MVRGSLAALTALATLAAFICFSLYRVFKIFLKIYGNGNRRKKADFFVWGRELLLGIIIIIIIVGM